MLPIALESLTYAELERLVDAGLSESRTLDFKRDAVGGRDDDKRELAADVSSFANTLGGDLVFGVDEDGGRATVISGLSVEDPDAELRRLEAIVRTGIEPRLPRGHELKWIEPPPGKQGVLVWRIPRSFAAPHRVTLRDHAKFYARSTREKHPMDTSELRAAFLSSDMLVQNIRRFRAERLTMIEAGEGVMPLSPGPRAILHVVPLSSFSSRSNVAVAEYGGRVLMAPHSVFGGSGSRYTLDGHATFSYDANLPGVAQGYSLLFRDGSIEAAFSLVGNTHGAISASSLEWPIIQGLPYIAAVKKQHEVEPPYYLFLSLLQVRGHRHLYGSRGSISPHTYNRDSLITPEIVAEQAPEDTSEAAVLLRPMFDIVWNAFGWPRAQTFDKDGKYTGEKW